MLEVFGSGLFVAAFAVLDLVARDEVTVFEGVFFAGAFFVGMEGGDFAAFASSSETSTYSLRISKALNALSIAATTLRAVGRRFVGAFRDADVAFGGVRFVEVFEEAALLADDFCLVTLGTGFLAVACLVVVLTVLAAADTFFFVALGVAFFPAATAFLVVLIEPSLAELFAFGRLTLTADFLATDFAVVFAFFERTDFAVDLPDFAAVLLVGDFLLRFVEDFVASAFADGLTLLLAVRDFSLFSFLVVLDAVLPVEVSGLVSDSLEVFFVFAGNVIRGI